MGKVSKALPPIEANSEAEADLFAHRTFSRRSPAVMASFGRMAGAVIKNFHRGIDGRARQKGANIAGLHMLEQ